MTTDNVVKLPRRPADNRAKARRSRDLLTDGLGLWLRIQSAFTGASLLDATPPALTLIWERHKTAARPWGRVLGSLRYLWGAVHTAIVAPALYFLVWATDSFPKLAVTIAALVTTLLWFPHFTFTIAI